MHHLRLLVVTVAAICVLALGVFAFVRAPKPQGGGDVIIIKGGSLTLECPDPADKNCMPFDSTSKVYKNKNGGGKVEQIVVMDSSGKPLLNGTFTRAGNFPDGKPQIAITYR
ncbi:MAG: hypothetical protein ABI698_04630 [bacterium]